MNNEIFNVRNIMIPVDEYPYIREDQSIGDGVALILEHSSADSHHLHYEELMVIDSDERLVGMLDTVGILKSFFPSVMGTSDVHGYVGKKQTFTDLSVLLEDHFRRECERQASELVRKYMRVPHQSIDGSMHTLHVLEIMIKDGEKTLPVTDKGILLGAVRVADVFRALGGYCTI